MKTVLFVTHKAVRCGIAQYGFDTVRELQKSKKYVVIHAQVESMEELNAEMSKAGKVDAMIWNYPVQLRAWVDENNPNKPNPIPTALINHDSSAQSGIDGSYRSPFFSDFIYFNPFLTSTKSFVHVIPRLIKKFNTVPSKTPHQLSIGTFGFATTVKKLKMFCDVVKENFGDGGAIIRVHIPPNDVVDPTGYSSNQFMDIIRENLPSMFVVERSNTYKTTEEMVQWLSENDLNVFFYEAGQLGLSSSLDYAISAGKPIAVNEVPAFDYLKGRHPSPYIEDYPQGTALREIIRNGDTFKDLKENSEEKFLLAWETALDKMTGRV
jgi:hypothetical protein